jgi:PEP-CTERM motif
MKHLLTCIVLGLTFAAAPVSAAPIQFSGNGHYYELAAPANSWNLAASNAAASTFLGSSGHLVTMSDPGEWNFVVSNFFDNASTRYYLGMHLKSGGSLTVSADYEWIDGSLMTESRWGPGQPDGTFSDAVSVTAYFSGNLDWEWDNSNASSFGPFGYVIEYDNPVLVPEPATMAMFTIGLAGITAIRRRRTTADAAI